MSEHFLFVVLFGLGLLSIVVFNFVVFYGAPFLPTRRQRVQEALDLLELEAGQTLLELGSGDGRLLRAAARRGIHSIGYELNPVLVLWSRLHCLSVRKFVTIHWANYWLRPLPPADAIYVFLLRPYMEKLHAKIRKEAEKPVRLVSFVFPLPDVKAVKEQAGFFVYEYTLQDDEEL